MNASSAPNVASGCSICGRCPAWLMTVNCACGKAAARACPYPGVTIRSLSPQSTRTGIRRDLAVVVSAEALFSLTDLEGLDPERAIASIVHTATTLTRAAAG